MTIEQHALGALAQREAQARSMLESLTTPTAIVDQLGVIVQVNRAWRDSSDEAGADPALTGEGANYRTVCTASANRGCEGAQAVLVALDAVLSGASPLETLDYERLGGRPPRTTDVHGNPL